MENVCDVCLGPLGEDFQRTETTQVCKACLDRMRPKPRPAGEFVGYDELPE